MCNWDYKWSVNKNLLAREREEIEEIVAGATLFTVTTSLHYDITGVQVNP